MAHANLHIICGNCGCNDDFTYSASLETDWDENDKEFQYMKVNISCKNCSTLHSLKDNATEENEES